MEIPGGRLDARAPARSPRSVLDCCTSARVSESKKPFHNPFAVLEKRRAELAPGPAAPTTPAPPTPKTPAPTTTPAPTSPMTEHPRGPARAVVRLERKGRRGKEVTVVEHLGLPAADLEAWLKVLKTGLGCGGVVEGDALALQGDQRARIGPLLVSRGVRKVTIA
jgi:translation initiation factor 1